jgi:hypothetical protein
MQFTNISDTETVQPYAQTMSMASLLAVAGADAQKAGGAAPRGGGMSFGTQGGINAKQYVATLVKHEYLNGFKLPDMPA